MNGLEEMNKLVNHVKVTVDSSGTPACKPDPVKAKGRRAIIRFHLDAEGYEFPDSDAVVIESGHSQFPHPSRTESPTLVTLLDLNTDRGTHKYTVTVKEKSSGKLIPLDPSIQNDDK